MRLEGLTALVTGASRGLGRAIAEAMWREGASLIVVARSQKLLHELQTSLTPAAGQSILCIAADLNDPKSVGAIMRTVSTIDILVNNAAIQGPIGPLTDNDLAEWNDTIQVNLLAPVALCKACVPLMIEQGKGKIINLSGGGGTGPRVNFTAYATAKAGLIRFSETLAQEVSAQHIDVNCVAPGALATHMLDVILAAGADRVGEREYAQAQKLKAQPDEGVLRNAADLCVFLASAESDGITGKLISAVWDPWQSLTAHRDELQTSDVYTLRRITPQDRGLDWTKS